MNQHHAESTPAGSSFHRGDPEMGDLPHRVHPDAEGRYTADVHVTPDGYARIGGRLYTPEQFAEILRRNGDYDGGPVRLIGCDAGSNDFAQRLSRELDTEVLAPNKPAWTDSNGNVFTSDVEIGPDGNPRPKIPPNGEWSTHGPDGTATRAGDDGFTPDTADADKQDVDADSAEARGGARRTPFDVDDWNQYEIPPDDPRFGRNVVEWPIENDRFRQNQPDGGGGNHPSNSAPSNTGGGSDDPFRRERGVEVEWGELGRVTDRPMHDPGSYLRPEGLPRELRGVADANQRLEPHTAYPVEYTVNGDQYASTTYYTDANGDIKWVELTPGRGPHPGSGNSGVAPPNPAFDYPLQANAVYRVENSKNPDKSWNFETDDRGSTVAMTGEPEIDDQSLPENQYRDDGGNYGGQSRAKLEGIQAYHGNKDYEEVWWAGGHYGAKEFGAPSEYGNMHPQMFASNSGSNLDGWKSGETWRRAFEEDLKRFEDSTGGEVENIQVISVSDGEYFRRRDSDGLGELDVARWRVQMPGPDGDPVTREFERVFPVVPENVYPKGTNVKHYSGGAQKPLSER